MFAAARISSISRFSVKSSSHSGIPSVAGSSNLFVAVPQRPRYFAYLLDVIMRKRCREGARAGIR